MPWGFTLVELLVVLAIIGLLIAILLPAMQAARESSRRNACSNSLKQLALAAHNHEAAHGFYPTGGWGHGWTGDADRGFGASQPGGWIFNSLPYLEQTDIHSMGSGKTKSEKLHLHATRMEIPLSLFSCPTRRVPRQYPVSTFEYRNQMANANPPAYVARSDYAINVGNQGQLSFDDGGPASEEIATTTYVFPNPRKYTGISFACSTVSAGKVSDGLSKTLLVGEKYLNPTLYETSADASDWGHIYSGLSNDNFRLAGIGFLLAPDTPDRSRLSVFGSAHSQCFFAYCDGSVHAVDFDIDPEVYASLGNRKDTN